MIALERIHHVLARGSIPEMNHKRSAGLAATSLTLLFCAVIVGSAWCGGKTVSVDEGREGIAQERDRYTDDQPREGDQPPEGGQPREGDQPRDRERPREVDRPREGDRPHERAWRREINTVRSSDRLLPPATAADPVLAQLFNSDLRLAAMRAMKKAATFYLGEVASYGGYVYYYSLDLQQRWGEGRAAPYTLFVQPPGTPTVGMAYLEAYAATGDSFYFDAACDAAEALVYGQLEFGGWTQVIHFARPERGRLGKYRKGAAGRWNVSSLDDGQTQAALQMLIQTDRAVDFKDSEIHEAALYGLKALLGAQFPNGAFPQEFQGPVEPKPVLKARFPDYDWRTEGRVKNYWDYYTLNDNVAGTVSDVLIDAHRVYGRERYRTALQRLGDFLILAQMPDPQPGWCQQYNYETIPIWARKFEPPAITGWESQDVMETLIKIACYTGNKKYLEPIPRALAYFQKSLLPDGSVARYYELRTNRPLYMDAAYRLTYDNSAVPGHYAWTQPADFGSIKRAYEDAQKCAVFPATPSTAELEDKVRTVIHELDTGGRWITTYAGERLV
jgi:PelA/Pel-15E family pectate lyase